MTSTSTTSRTADLINDFLAKLVDMQAAPRFAHPDSQVQGTCDSIVRMAARIAPEPSDRYHKVTIRYEVLGADGQQLNYGWPEPMAAARDAARRGGATVVMHYDEHEVTASDRALIDSGIAEEHWGLLRADATRAMNMTRDAGRPSDAIRSAIGAFKAGHLTDESFAASRPSGHYPED